MAITWCSSEGGFKIHDNNKLSGCFVNTLLFLPTAIVVLTILPVLIVLLRRQWKIFGQSCIRFKNHSWRWILTLLLVLSFVAKIGEGFMYQQRISTTPLHLYIPHIFSVFSLVVVTIYYDVIEVSKTFAIKKLSLIFVYWLSGVIVWLLKFVQLYQVDGPYDLRLYTSIAILVFYILLLILEKRVIFSHFPQRTITSLWKRANESEAEHDECQEFSEGKIKFVHNFSNFLSRCTFSWFFDTLKLGSKRPLEMEDLGNLPFEDKADANHKKFAKFWEEEKSRAIEKKTSPSLWRTFFVAYRRLILTAASCKLASDLLSFIGPLCLKQIVHFVEDSLKSNSEEVKPKSEHDVYMSSSDFFGNGYVLSVVILLGTIASSTFSQQYYYYALKFSMNLRASLQVNIES